MDYGEQITYLKHVLEGERWAKGELIRRKMTDLKFCCQQMCDLGGDDCRKCPVELEIDLTFEYPVPTLPKKKGK